MYTKKVLDHFRNPRNMGVMKGADATGQKGNPVCGDVMKIYLRVKRGKSWGENVIEEIRFQTLGCVAAVAITSCLTEMVLGKGFAEVKKIKVTDIARELGGLPSVKMHCSVLGLEVLKEAMGKIK